MNHVKVRKPTKTRTTVKVRCWRRAMSGDSGGGFELPALERRICASEQKRMPKKECRRKECGCSAELEKNE